ncbi:MAG: RNA-binding transcriptional accessory protein [Deltaproteobacteria bacterium]|jgi:protein Tex|nr:RNA-binding transcriptional accessory protein [Deltaproteobacteria bacterium]
MNERHIATVAKELNIPAKGVIATANLLNEGSTVPFISRYRKEMTGSLDEVVITSIRDRLSQLADLDVRRAAILKSLDERDLLTDELKAAIEGAEVLSKLEDIYLPYRPKRRTRATIARERGLEPLATSIMEQMDAFDPEGEAKAYIDSEKGVESVEDALQGARDIVAEWINEDADARALMRNIFTKKAVVDSKVLKGKDDEGAKFRDYFEIAEPIAKMSGHRLLAILRGEREKVLRVTIRPDADEAIEILTRKFAHSSNPSSEQVRMATEDCYRRMLAFSMETELRIEAKERADEEAIGVFSENLRELLMAAPLGEKVTLAIDPGFRTGCKIVVLSAQGGLLHNTAIFPTQSDRQRTEAAETIRDLCKRHNVEAIAIGNGTASRETESFVRTLELPKNISVVMVNESGASIYSASEIAREEFPKEDVTVRGSISIGRRLMDPLAELVKIDPKSIGVGQYQHDVDQSKLKRSLDDVVVSCVNGVGVEVNTASFALLAYVSGLGESLAKNIANYREERGPFTSRAGIKKVPRLGPKAYEQAAGFLRIRNAKNPLDASAVHPESYGIIEGMAGDLKCTVADLMKKADLREKIDIKKYVTDSVGLPTLKDIMDELAKPGRDPRASYEQFSFAEGVHKPEDLKPGMRLPGIVTNVTNFGAFVDVGVHQDGLVHVSQLADRFIKNPMDVVKVNQKVSVRVVDVDLKRSRIALSMRSEERNGAPKKNGRVSS